ncbi:hypothetical protein [Streptomyces sp. NPDC004065]|uniref:hypothetical protein n=1 Tax=Streptomyces sp. NPDC004065 TaxID=3364689 RepID=UPI003850D517
MTFVECGALLFGVVVGWQAYFVNRYRARVAVTDVAAIVAVLGGGTVLTLFPEQTRLFAAYGVGLALGFFGYFVLLVVLVLSSGRRSAKGTAQGEPAEGRWTMEWFLDGRRPKLKEWQIASDGSRAMGRPEGTPRVR